MTLEVVQDGLTYVVKITSPASQDTIDGLLREDPDGWRIDGIYINNKAPGDSHQLGRRKTWQKALHDTLVYMEARLRAAKL